MKNKITYQFIVLALVLVQVWFGYVISQYSYLGILLEQTNSSNWIIKELEAGSGSEKLNLKIGDSIILVDGKHPDDHLTIARWGHIEQAETIIVSRDGESIEISTKSASEDVAVTNFYLLGCIICLAFAYLIYSKACHFKSSQLLFLLFLNIAFIFTSFGASIRGDVLGKITIHSLMIALPFLFLHFLIVFMKERAEINFSLKFIRYLYGYAAISFLAKLTFFFPIISSLFYETAYSVVIISFLIGLSLNVYFLIYFYIKFRNQNQYVAVFIKTMFWTLIISFAPFSLLSFIPLLLYEKLLVNTIYTAWFILIFPISVAYLIISKQLYDIDLVLRRVGFTIIIAIIPSAAIVGLTAIIFSKDVTVKHLLLSFIVTVTLLSFIIYSLEYFATKLQPVMFPRKHQLQLALKKISVNLQTISSYRELKEIILVDIVQTLELFGAAIAFKYTDRVEAVLAGDIELAEVESLASADPSDVTPKRRFEINRHEEYTSYLIITRKKKNTFLAMEEEHWLNLLVSYLAVGLDNMHLIGKLNVRLQKLAAQLPNEQASKDFIWFRKLMFELQENERQRIATDIHDTTLQDLFFLKKRLTELLKKVELAGDEEETRSIIEYVEIINTNLRQSCFELHPHLLHEIGLLRTIRKVIEHESPFCPFELEFHDYGVERAELWDLDKKRHFFRIVQELLNNAKKHSQANRVSMTMSVEGGSIVLHYKDDGKGLQLSIAKNTEPEIGDSGMGMAQMKSRVLYMDGQFDFRTGRGKGLQVWIRVPIGGAGVA